ncbi:MAG: hypothetical protein IKT05_07020 [Fibrobacter sp.]|nr:hypothetical protein [Fibrobacter sp.]
MNKKAYSLVVAIFCACSNSGLEDSVAQSESPNQSNLERAFVENMGDSILPYFEFDEQGQKLQYFKEYALKKEIGRKDLILKSVDDFLDMEESYAKHLAEDAAYSHSIKRPLDYVCRTSWLAMNEDYSSIALENGDTLLSDKILFESCKYIGFKCDGCDDTAEEDPYLKRPKALKKESVEDASFNSSITVEIDSYRMIAESFISDYKIFSTAGSETYFKKRQRVWRGPFTGMVWRWADFDPDRNGIRSYCFSGCGYDMYGKFSCDKRAHETDLDKSFDTEDITVRCKITPVGEFSTGHPSAQNENLTGFNPNANTQLTGNEKDPHFRKATEYGVIGMHYVKHKDLEFRAKTSANLTKTIREGIVSTYTLSYR